VKSGGSAITCGSSFLESQSPSHLTPADNSHSSSGLAGGRFNDGCRSSPTGGGHGASHRTKRRRWRGSRYPRTPGTGRGPGCSGRTPGCKG